MLRPPPLSSTDRIRIVAPSGPVNQDDLLRGLRRLRYPVEISETIFSSDGYWAGSKSHRQLQLQLALDDPSIGAILCARGGFGITSILDDLNMSSFLTHPKWIVGNSDITALLIHLWAIHGICTIHGPMAASMDRYPQSDIDALHQILQLGFLKEACKLQPICNGTATGPLIGGNLTMLAHMMGTLPPESANGCILFLEDVAEAPYRIERCLIQLKRNRILQQLCGIVLGEFTNCKPGLDGITVETVIARNLTPLQIPIASGYPAAHGTTNRPFVHGHPTTLTVQGNSASLQTT